MQINFIKFCFFLFLARMPNKIAEYFNKFIYRRKIDLLSFEIIITK